MMRVIDILPRSKMEDFEEYIELPNEQLTDTEWLCGFYGELINEKLPLSSKIFNEIYEMSTPMWKNFWQTWKDEGILN